MRSFFAKISEIWGIDELRQRIILTLTLLAVYRFGSFVVLPGINADILVKKMLGSGDNGLMGLLNAFTGGSFASGAVFALGIMPYISASIIVQLLGFAVPYFARLQREGENGQRKLNQITRVITIAITIVQASAYLTNLKATASEAISPDIPATIFWFSNVIILVAGTMFCMWLGERITDKGIGNGTSLLITAGIINSLPGAFWKEFSQKVFSGQGGGPILFLVEIIILVFIIIAVIALVQAVRKIQIQFAKHLVGRADMGAEAINTGATRDYLPIKLNAAGVMPIIFAQAIMFIIGAIGGYLVAGETGGMSTLSDFRSPAYNMIFFTLVVAFTYVYTALIINPQQYAEQLKRQNAFIPEVEQGAPTEEHIDKITTRITLPGAIALGVIAILPGLASLFLVTDNTFALFYGGTSLLILVAVVLDTLQQVEGHLLMRRYDGLIKGGRIKGRNAERATI